MSGSSNFDSFHDRWLVVGTFQEYVDRYSEHVETEIISKRTSYKGVNISFQLPIYIYIILNKNSPNSFLIVNFVNKLKVNSEI